METENGLRLNPPSTHYPVPTSSANNRSGGDVMSFTGRRGRLPLPTLNTGSIEAFTWLRPSGSQNVENNSNRRSFDASGNAVHRSASSVASNEAYRLDYRTSFSMITPESRREWTAPTEFTLAVMEAPLNTTPDYGAFEHEILTAPLNPEHERTSYPNGLPQIVAPPTLEIDTNFRRRSVHPLAPNNAAPHRPGPIRTQHAVPERYDPLQNKEEVYRGCVFANPEDTFCKDIIEHPRKCTSQFFGRNKNETRMIPKLAWAYACRKHYQRQNYGNRTTYWRAQLHLINQQLDKFEDYMGKENIRFIIKPQNQLKAAMEQEDRRMANIARAGGAGGVTGATGAGGASGVDGAGEANGAGGTEGPPVTSNRATESEVSLRKAANWMIAHEHLSGYDKTTDDVRAFFAAASAACDAHLMDGMPEAECLMKPIKPSTTTTTTTTTTMTTTMA